RQASNSSVTPITAPHRHPSLTKGNRAKERKTLAKTGASVRRLGTGPTGQLRRPPLTIDGKQASSAPGRCRTDREPLADGFTDRYTQPADMPADQAEHSLRSCECLALSALRPYAPGVLRARPRTDTDAVRACPADPEN